MCDPTTLAMASLAMGVVGAGVSYDQQSKQASYQAEVNKRNQEAAMQAYRDTTASQQLQTRQEFEGAQQQAQAVQKEQQAVSASARVAAGESGIMGSTVDALFREIAGQGAENTSSIYTNYLRAHQAGNDNLQNTSRQAANSIVNLPPVQRPGGLSTALRIGGTAMNTYSTYKQGGFGQHDNMWKKP